MNNAINYIELPTQDLARTKQFFTEVFGWVFTDYGPKYSSFSSDSAGLDGGFFSAESVSAGGALVVIHHSELETVLDTVTAAEGTSIVKPIFSFPGGRRFEFIEPGGNRLAVWSKAE
jgi:predicted enzyme related to lactoylglutathione lyase